MDANTILQLFIIFCLLYIIFNNHSENLCVNESYGVVTDVPASNYPDAALAYDSKSSLGQAPLGDPKYWIGNNSPITQGQWGLYQPNFIPLSKTQPYDRKNLYKIFDQIPVYTNDVNSNQCTALN